MGWIVDCGLWTADSRQRTADSGQRAAGSGVEWSGVWSVECGVEWSGVEWSGVEWSGTRQGRAEQSRVQQYRKRPFSMCMYFLLLRFFFLLTPLWTEWMIYVAVSQTVFVVTYHVYKCNSCVLDGIFQSPLYLLTFMMRIIRCLLIGQTCANIRSCDFFSAWTVLSFETRSFVRLRWVVSVLESCKWFTVTIEIQSLSLWLPILICLRQ